MSIILVVLVILLCILQILSIIVQHPDFSDKFRLGKFSFSRFSITDIVIHAVKNCEVESQNLVSHLDLLIQSYENWTLSMVENALVDNIFDYQISSRAMSHYLCQNIYTNGFHTLAEKELYFQLALLLNPRNIYAIKNYGFQLEWHGHYTQVYSLYHEVLGCKYVSSCVTIVELYLVHSAL